MVKPAQPRRTPPPTRKQYTLRRQTVGALADALMSMPETAALLRGVAEGAGLPEGAPFRLVLTGARVEVVTSNTRAQQ